MKIKMFVAYIDRTGEYSHSTSGAENEITTWRQKNKGKIEEKGIVQSQSHDDKKIIVITTISYIEL